MKCFICVATILVMASQSAADAPIIRTPTPVIYLADNLDEQDQLGWCIDTQGRGFSETLHAHSCKPQGGDVQFVFDTNTGQIRSFEYPGFCAASQFQAQAILSLVECDGNEANQSFIYDQNTGEFTPADNRSLCLTVGGNSRSAGPFMSRELGLSQCANGDASLRTWVVLQ